MKKPLIVYVSGAPGSGKTTLAKLVSEQLYIPLISSDLVHGGVALSNPEHSRQETLKNVFVPAIIGMSQKGVSVVVDHVLQKDLSEVDIIDKLLPHAEIVYIHTQCANPIERYKNRTESSGLPNDINQKELLLNRAEHHQNNLGKTSEALDLNLPTLVVNTDDGYKPSLDEIIAFIHTNYAV